jgi:hypothetical protein
MEKRKELKLNKTFVDINGNNHYVLSIKIGEDIYHIDGEIEDFKEINKKLEIIISKNQF